DLPIRERAVRRRGHRAEIGFADRRADRRASELAVGQAYPVLRGRGRHLAQVLGADLMAEAARAAMDRREDRSLGKAESGRDIVVEDFGDVLDLEVVVARAERAHLVALARACALRDVLRGRAGHSAAFLDALEIRRLAVAPLDGPPRAAGEHRVHLRVVEPYPPGAADAG